MDPALLQFASNPIGGSNKIISGSGGRLQVVEAQSQIHPIENDIPRRIPLRKIRRRKEAVTDTQVALRMLAKTREEMIGISKHLPSLEERDAWGYKSNKDNNQLELTSSITTAGMGTRKPPMLNMMEHLTITGLSHLNSLYKNSDFNLLPISHVESKDEDWSAVALSLVTLRDTTSDLPTEAALKMLVNDQQEDQNNNNETEKDVKPEEGTELDYRCKRLEVFRRMTRIFTSAFKTYRPLLSWVFTEYESYFSLLTSTIQSLQQRVQLSVTKISALKLQLQTKESANTNILKAKERSIGLLQRKCDRLMIENAKVGRIYTQNKDHIKSLQENAADLEEVKTYLQKQVSKLERKLHDEQHQQEKEMRAKLANDLDRTIKQLTDLRRLHEVILKENRFYKEKFETIQKQNEKADEEQDNEEKSDTPRPNWSETSLQGIEWKGNTAATVLSMGSQIQEMTQKLCCESNSCEILNRRYILGLGLGSNVQPSFLRFQGRLINLKLSKSKVEQAIKQFWREKDRCEDTRSFSPAAFFPMFISDRYGPAKAMEMLYNMWYSLQKYKADPDCGLLYKILGGSVDEVVWREQTRLVYYLREVLCGADEDSTEMLDITEIMAATKNVFPTKEESSFRVLEIALRDSCSENSTDIPYLKLFDEDSECNQSAFIETLRTQHIIERDEYLNEIEDSLIGHDDASDGIISIPEMINAIRAVDDTPDDALNVLISRAFGIDKDKDHMKSTSSILCSLSDVVARLKTGNVKRYSKKRQPAPPEDSSRKNSEMKTADKETILT